MLRIEDLSVRYNKSLPYIIQNANFDLEAGDFVLLTGISGCGKSTLIKALNGILYTEEQVEGKIILGDNDISNTDANFRSNYIGSVLQNADEQIIFDKVEDELAFPLENMALDRDEITKRILKYSTMMNLDIEQRTSKLSGGQKQSLITAATFGMERKILIFDEPLANLDNKAAIKLLENLKRLCIEKSYIVLFVEHRIDLLLKYVNKILYMNNGKVKTLNDNSRFKEYLDTRIKSIKEKLTSYSGMETPVFEITDLSYSVKGREILKNINYTFMKGGKYVILGDNGSGKTTFINLLTGIYKPSEGSLKTSISNKGRFKKIGLVMQNPNYQLFMPSVRQELSLQSKDDKYLEFLIAIMGLESLLDKHPHSLSEGQKRRVGVSAILSMMPEVLILDEPSVGQDYKHMSDMIRAISKLCSINPETTVISISHDLRCLNNLGDQFVNFTKI